MIPIFQASFYARGTFDIFIIDKDQNRFVHQPRLLIINGFSKVFSSPPRKNPDQLLNGIIFFKRYFKRFTTLNL